MEMIEFETVILVITKSKKLKRTKLNHVEFELSFINEHVRCASLTT